MDRQERDCESNNSFDFVLLILVIEIVLSIFSLFSADK